MRPLLLAAVILCLVGSPAMSGKNEGGALVVHTDDTLAFSDFAAPDNCALYETVAP